MTPTTSPLTHIFKGPDLISIFDKEMRRSVSFIFQSLEKNVQKSTKDARFIGEMRSKLPRGMVKKYISHDIILFK